MMTKWIQSFFSDIQDFALVIGMIGILLILFTPIPAAVLDFLLLLNFSAALLILLVTFYTDKPLKFSTFPSLLLMTTLFRLALNISATRLILDDADAGKFIGSVGEYVVGGNYVIGLVVFLILVVVQYVVVTSGAQRVAEVAARFTLDSLPGKQMSVDADLNMGIIDHEEAKKRRKELEKECNFYGAMDGASKFVKGDAIAGIIIILIDIIGGLSIGIAQMGMTWSEAVYKFTLLTIGDGIVTQVPSLIIAVATGIIITRAATDARLGNEIINQFSMKPKTLIIVAIALLAFVFFPGMPVVPVVIISSIVAFLAWLAYSRNAREEDGEPEKPLEMEDAQGDKLFSEMICTPLELKVSADLTEFLQKESVNFEKRLNVMRKNFAKELGFVMPTVSIKKEAMKIGGEYQLAIMGENYMQGEVKTDKLLAIKTDASIPDIPGIHTTDPTYNLPAIWIAEEQRRDAKNGGYTVVEPELVLLTHMQETLKQNASSLITRQSVEELILKRKSELGAVVEELIPAQLSYSDLQSIFKHLLKEQVSIRNLPIILDLLVDISRQVKDPTELAERCREALKGGICESLVDGNNEMKILTLDPEVERKFAVSTEGQTTTPLSPSEVERFVLKVVSESEKLVKENITPVLVCSSQARRHVKRLLSRSVPQLRVLSVNEIDQKVTIATAGVIGF